MFIWMIAIGLLIGLLVGLTGIGGGSLLTPLLLWAGIPPSAAIGTGLVAATVTKAAASVEHGRRGTVNWRLVGWLALGSVPTSVAAVFMLHAYVAHADWFIKYSLGWVLIATASVTILQNPPWVQRLLPPPKANGMGSVPAWIAIGLGIGVGALTGITSVGSGSLLMVSLMFLTGLAPRELVGTDLVHGLMLTLATALAYWHLGHVQWLLVGGLIIGSIPGALVGARLAYRISPKPLKLALAVVLLITGITLL